MKTIFFLFMVLATNTAFSEPRYAWMNDAIAGTPKKAPSVMCVEDQCASIGFYYDVGNMLVAETTLHNQDFLGWRPPCYGCTDEEHYHAAANALTEQVKTRFPEAETGYTFKQYAY